MTVAAWRVAGTMLGLATADALGAPLEFKAPAVCRRAVDAGLEMTGGGPWEAGEWTDDTAMALALAESIAQVGLLDTADVVQRYIAWAKSRPKDIGVLTGHVLRGAHDAADAAERAQREHKRSGRTAGNGTIMRAAPIALVAASLEDAVDAAHADALLTHFDPAAGMASAALCAALLAIADESEPLAAARTQVDGHEQLLAAVDAAIARDEQALAALAAGPEFGTCWAALGVGLYALGLASYEEGVLWSISLGQDTDTNAAVAGALLGCRFGVDGIPERWLGPLRERDRLERAAAAIVARRRPEAETMAARSILWGRDFLALGEIAVRAVGGSAAVGLSRGAKPKAYAYTDPNEDGVAVVAGPRAVLLVCADGHNGFEAAYAAVLHVLDRLGHDPPPADLPDGEVVKLFYGAGEAIQRVTRAPGFANPESRAALALALVTPTRLQWAAMGDCAVVVASSATGTRLDRPRSHFVGYPMTLPEVAERLPRGVRDLDDELVVLASDGFTDFVDGRDPASAVAATCALEPEPDRLARALIERAFAGGAGDNVAVAVAAPALLGLAASAPLLDAGGTPYPPYVRTEEERRRWDLSVGLASSTSAELEESGLPDPAFVWQTARILYRSEIPTGSQAEADEVARLLERYPSAEGVPSGRDRVSGYRSAWGSGGRYLHDPVGELSHGELFTDTRRQRYRFVTRTDAGEAVVQSVSGDYLRIAAETRVRRVPDGARRSRRRRP